MEKKKVLINQVYPAEPYCRAEMGSLGRASGMLIRQYRFPDSYESTEQLLSADSDRVLGWNRKAASKCLTRHSCRGDVGLGHWFMHASDDQAMAFLKDFLGAESTVTWTGYRVLGTVGGNGQPVWTLELFARNQNGSTVVYTGSPAPNILKRSRHGR